MLIEFEAVKILSPNKKMNKKETRKRREKRKLNLTR